MLELYSNAPSLLYQSSHVHHTLKPAAVRMCHCVLFPPSPHHTPKALLPCPPHLWLSDSVGPGYSPVVRPALNAGLLPPNYQLQGSASTPGAGQAGNELSPLGWTSGWAVYGGGWALPSGGVNGPSRGTVSRADPSESLITERASCCIAVQPWMFISCIRTCHCLKL